MHTSDVVITAVTTPSHIMWHGCRMSEWLEGLKIKWPLLTHCFLCCFCPSHLPLVMWKTSQTDAKEGSMETVIPPSNAWWCQALSLALVSQGVLKRWKGSKGGKEASPHPASYWILPGTPCHRTEQNHHQGNSLCLPLLLFTCSQTDSLIGPRSRRTIIIWTSLKSS